MLVRTLCTIVAIGGAVGSPGSFRSLQNSARDICSAYTGKTGGLCISIQKQGCGLHPTEEPCSKHIQEFVELAGEFPPGICPCFTDEWVSELEKGPFQR
jgi:hypothetical protein